MTRPSHTHILALGLVMFGLSAILGVFLLRRSRVAM
jgi:hypothetical protein